MNPKKKFKKVMDELWGEVSSTVYKRQCREQRVGFLRLLPGASPRVEAAPPCFCPLFHVPTMEFGEDEDEV
jgi:hypothetical protein